MLAIAALSGGFTLNNLSPLGAQQPSWQPQRLPSASNAQPLNQVSAGATGQLPASSAAIGDREQLGSGVVLRWKSSTTRQLSSATPPSNYQPVSPDANPTGLNSRSAFDQSAQSQRQTAFVDNNPLRRASNEMNNAQQPAAVRFANYQQDVTADPFGDKAPLQLPSDNLPALPSLPGAPGSDPAQAPQIVAPVDPLESPEQAPAPGSVLEEMVPNPFGKRPQGEPSASDQPQGELVPRPRAEPQSNQDLRLPRDRQRDLLSCDDLRDRIRNRPLTDVSLDTSPSFGEGLRSIDLDAEQQRLEFAANSASRDWSDNTGQVIARGRLLDLRDDRVVLDVNGTEQTIPLQKLSDGDIGYVGEAWTLPIKCGTGNASYIGRNFIPSAAQWKAPGHCHKPAYFEQPQLERYGHEVGPVLQPILSTAHFFGNIAVLPYKMGIHPPNECQYSLGYFRPGNCAPYMLQPIPLSLRGAAVQAGFVTGAAALIP